MKALILVVALIAVIAAPILSFACPPPPAPGYDGSGGGGDGSSGGGDGSGGGVDSGGDDDDSGDSDDDATTNDVTA
jgi:hypothetical protein